MIKTEDLTYYMELPPDEIETIKIIGLSVRGIKLMEDKDYSILGNRVYFPETIVYKHYLFDEVTKLTDKLT